MEIKILHSLHPLPAGDFPDPRVVLHHATGAELEAAEHPVRNWDDCGVGLHQAFDGPTHLVIGRHASDKALARAATRLAVATNDLTAFRDGWRSSPSA